jgi:aryl-alcohol dehydrogenase-like predicted oxidoreductase
MTKIVATHGRNPHSDIDKSLSELGTDHVEICFIHKWDSLDSLRRCIECLSEELMKGRIMCIGASVNQEADIPAIYGISAISTIQLPYNILDRWIYNAINKMEQKYRILAYSPLAKGILTRSLEHFKSFGVNDRRIHLPRFQRLALRHYISGLEDFRALARDLKITTTQLSIIWILQKSSIISAIVGAKSVIDLPEIASLPAVVLSKDDFRRIDSAVSRIETTWVRQMLPRVGGLA